MSQVVDYTIINRMVRAVELVRERLLRTVNALTAAKIAHAVAGGNAVAAWVSKIDPGAARNTTDVDVLVRRGDLQPIVTAMEADGFIYRHSAGLDMFLDGPTGSAREGIHLLFANEKVRASESSANPDVSESEWMGTFNSVSLEPLVRLKLTANRRKDQVHIEDLISVGLIDASWPARFPPPLAERLQHLLDTAGEASDS